MKRISGFLFAFLTISAIYLYALPAPNVFYAAVVLAHIGGGILFSVLLFLTLRQRLREPGFLSKTGLILLIVGALLGLAVIKLGGARPEQPFVFAHAIISGLAAALLIGIALGKRGWLANAHAGRAAIMLAVAVAVSVIAYGTRNSWHSGYKIENPKMPPATMDEEGDGANGPFFPSSAQVRGTDKIPPKFFMESDACERCHQDAYKQWFGSAHHFSSFNNQWYRASIEYMQDVVGTKPSKWCGGCHDPAVLYSGMMDTPIKEIVHRPEAQAGLGCMMCHSIAKVKSTMGQGDFVLEYPKLHELAATKNPVMRWLHDFSIRVNPEPHRRVFLKPFMKDQTAEFCSSCHKVHLDVPVNGYRWIRGFNEYDNWQASGVSGMGARSFYYPPKAQDCGDCHMPAVPSKDFGNIGGFVHSHAFPGANTAVPTANEDKEHLELTEKFLKSGALTIDIFALSQAKAESGGEMLPGTEMATTFAVGEEAELKSPSEGVREHVEPVTAPLNKVGATVRRGDDVRLDVVVRTKKVGHFFPGGTVDAYDTWVELKATDENDRVLFWSGKVEDDGKGPVEKGAHFYRSLMMDAQGNPINKRNAWANRAVVYVRLIPPGAADTIHYRLKLPKDAGKKIKLHARLCYRKFAWWNTQFSFAGRIGNGEKGADFDNRPMYFDADLSKVSAKTKKIPDVPIVSLAENEVELNVADPGAKIDEPKVVLAQEDWQRWNDYGIGLLLQGDLKAAQAAFTRVTEVDPKNPDGWVNIGRVAVQEGDMQRAREVLEKALQLSPDLARAHFFFARVLKTEGDYDGALSHLQKVLAQYPKDRVVRNEAGRVLFLQRKYQQAVQQFEETLLIDPEDLSAHYNLMLSYKGLGDAERAKQHELRYLRFKADEAAQALTGPYRNLHPHDNNERQAIHEHVSVNISQTKAATSVANKLNRKDQFETRVRVSNNSGSTH